MKTDPKLMQYSLYAAGTGLLIYLGIATINNVDHIVSAIVGFLGKMVDLGSPLLVALVIAYLLNPGVKGIENFLEQGHVLAKPSTRRIVGIVVVYLLSITVFLAVLYGIYIMIGGKLSNNTTLTNISAFLSDYLKNSAQSEDVISKKLESLNIPIPANLHDKIAQIVSYVQEYFSSILGQTTNFIFSLGANIASFLISTVLSVYLIKDSEYFAGLWDKFFVLVFGKSTVGRRLTEILAIVDDTFKNYIKGQLLEAVLVGILSAIVLYFIGVDYALMIGIISGICNMIPYIGPAAGMILAVIMALLSGQPITALWAVVGMIAVQQVDNHLLAPKIVGDSVGLHPVFIVLAILIGGSVGGLIGMLTAVPVVASLKILLSKWYAAHMEKSAL